ncbi:hypothetical protein SDC9_114924 [bioreactor metagenome]|uniref:Uncharacterized protein n=1 Tax=bioreactor metagenome TaxID=1076179 RepID=A0A645BSD9_9ZZZZ
MNKILIFGFEQVRRTAGDHFRIANRLAAHFFVDGCGQHAVFAVQQRLGFLGENLIALAIDDVEHGLRADDLACGRDQRRIAKVFAYTRHLFENLIILVGLARFLELGDQVREHAARYLIQQCVGIHAEGLDGDRAVGNHAIRNGAHDLRGFGKLHQIEAGVAVGSPEGGNQRLRRGLRRAVSKGRQGGVHDVYASLRRHEVNHVAGAGRIMGMQVNRNLDFLL